VQAGIPAVQVPAAAATITAVMADRMSRGQVSEALAELPVELRATITGDGTVQRSAETAGATPDADDRIDRLEDQIRTLTEAVRALARGLQGGQQAEFGRNDADISRAARFADEILITTGT
jgi:hypothetical protein